MVSYHGISLAELVSSLNLQFAMVSSFFSSGMMTCLFSDCFNSLNHLGSHLALKGPCELC